MTILKSSIEMRPWLKRIAHKFGYPATAHKRATSEAPHMDNVA